MRREINHRWKDRTKNSSEVKQEIGLRKFGVTRNSMPLIMLVGELSLRKDSPATPHLVSFRLRMVLLALILVVIVFVGSEIWVSRYGPQIADRLVAAYSILAAFSFVAMYLYRRNV